MKLYAFDSNGEQHLGLERSGKLVDLTAAGVATDLLSLIRRGGDGLEQARQANGPELPLQDARLKAPLKPGKILCSGINYHGHFEENPNATMPSEPFFFAKLPNSVIGPDEPIILPPQSKQVDYEVEFTVVIGKTMHNTPVGEAIDSVFGYTILHDVSARDVQFKESQITLGKNFDTFAPIGPCVVTRDEFSDLSDVRLRAYLNDEVVQDGSTGDWVFPLANLVSGLSQVMTLEPGDLVTTGTPAGVGVFRNPQVFLKPGDTVRMEVQGIGCLENRVVAQ